MEVTRKQRTSDGTITVEGVRYEIPSIYRTLLRPTVRVARWDLSSVDLVDPRRGRISPHFCRWTRSATPTGVAAPSSIRRWRPPRACPAPAGIAPLLRQLMAEYAATGLPPAYVPHDTTVDRNDGGNDTEHEHHEPEEHL